MDRELIRKTHVILVPLPFQGHTSPMIQFSKRLASKGLRVTMIAAKDTTKSGNPQATGINIEYISYEHEEDQSPGSVEEYMANIQRRVSTNLIRILEEQKSCGNPIKVLVHDSLLPWAVDLGHQLGLLVAQFFTQTCAVCALFYHVHQGNIKIPLKEESVVSVPSIPTLNVKELPSDIYREVYPGTLDMLTSQFLNVQKADWVFFNTFLELENEVAEWMSSQWPILTIGPSIPSMFLDKRLPEDKDYGLSFFKPNTESCIKWLDTKDTASTVYVSFGSLAMLDEVDMAELAWGLLNSNNNFLWVVRDSEKSKLPSSFIAASATKGLIVSWCPQLEVLAHRAVGSFMTHCGWNSTLEALSLGVPMLAIPQWIDQTTNAKYIVDVWKTGVRVKPLDKESVTREEISNCINGVMDGELGHELRVNAVRWKKMAVEALSEGGSSDKNIDEFISNIISTTT